MMNEPEILTRTTFLIKGPHIGAFFLNCSEVAMNVASRNFVWTFDPRLTPCMYYYQYTTRDLALERYAELIRISQQNGWTVRFTGQANNAQLS